ncbi:hypothetical protein N9A45_01465 [bacterium]|nr:hypothetical protein [bacterium]
MFACAGSNPADGTLVVSVINTLRARGHWFDSFIGDAPLISTVGSCARQYAEMLVSNPAPSTSETR